MSERSPDVSFIMPCYNEESSIRYSIPRLIEAFSESGAPIEIVAVNNGSQDRTGEIIRQLADKHPEVVPHEVRENRGYGFGVLSGIPRCSGRWVGIIPADGQVDAEDVVRLYEAAAAADGLVLAKARRRFRMDGLRRKVVSVAYNLLVRVLWPGLGSLDVNGSPKILPREVLLAMNLKSEEWFLDPELMIKAHHMGIRTLELNVFARMRGSGLSHVHLSTGRQFLRKLFEYRLTGRWKEDIDQGAAGSQSWADRRSVQRVGSESP